MPPKAKSIVYVGIKTYKFDELCKFYGEVLGLKRDHFEPDFATYLFPNGDKVEIYGPNDPHEPNHAFFTTGPVTGFEVDDINEARSHLEKNGIEFLSPIEGSKSKWTHFRGPDGNVYEIKQTK